MFIQQFSCLGVKFWKKQEAFMRMGKIRHYQRHNWKIFKYLNIRSLHINSQKIFLYFQTNLLKNLLSQLLNKNTYIYYNLLVFDWNLILTFNEPPFNNTDKSNLISIIIIITLIYLKFTVLSSALKFWIFCLQLRAYKIPAHCTKN